MEFICRREIDVIRATSYIRGVTMSFIIFTTRMSLFITVLVYVLFDNKITAEKVFMVTAYYNILRTTMTVFFPQGIYTRIHVPIRRTINYALSVDVWCLLKRAGIFLRMMLNSLKFMILRIFLSDSRYIYIYLSFSPLAQFSKDLKINLKDY